MSESTPAHGLPEPRRRRVAPPIADPMAPPVLAQPAPPAPTTEPAAAPRRSVVDPATPAAGQTERPAAPQAEAPGAASAGLRRPRSEATAALYVRVRQQTRTRFDELAADGGLTGRALVEQLVDQAWHARHGS